MLGIDFNVDVKSVQFPIYFDYERNNQCNHCGRLNTLVMKDRFGNRVREEIYPFDHIECINCGQKYTIKWIDVAGQKRAFAAEPSIARQFMNFVNHKIDRVLGK